ncbi:DUF2812 domain-containing protein [Bacillus sp. JCM 19034]|uniref:DUF2812 domain-containing protein n=1 Tax=Bacillus sp. JCM 19034 TaxID=1481928 RepID=UPI000783B209|nr:DUF2812 domain-containing protein [Bacillus sp. JCM 19034]
MKQTKYVMSGGLAFSEEKDMEKLRQFSLKGWHVSNFSFMGYTLEKGPSSDYIYSIDYRSLHDEESEEYFGFFAASGWTHVTSEGDMHLFRATPGTKPIYSDRETQAEKHDHLGKSMKWTAISVIFITILVWLGVLFSSGSLQVVLAIIAVISTVITIPMSWTVTAIYKNKWETDGKRRLAAITKMLPFLFLFLVVVSILLVVNDLRSAIRILTSMAIGGVILPTVIWIIMSLYHKIRRGNS